MMTLFFMVAAFVFVFGVYPQPGAGTGLWWGLVIAIMCFAVAVAAFEGKLNKMRDYLRMLHDHQHREEEDAEASHE